MNFPIEICKIICKLLFHDFILYVEISKFLYDEIFIWNLIEIIDDNVVKTNLTLKKNHYK